MISLLQLLKETQSSPKAIFLAGPAGSGKSYISKQFLPNTFKWINSDDTYEELLKASGIGLKQKDFTPDELSQASKLQAQARNTTKDILSKSIEGRQNLVIDGTGAASNPLLKKKQELEDLGYETFMLMIYVSPLTSLERNVDRERSLMPGIILRTWEGVNRNIDTYRQAFGESFIIIDNDPEGANKGFSQDLISPYLKGSSAIGKPKTPEQEAQSREQKLKLKQDIENIIGKIPKFTPLEVAKQKISQFTS